MILSRPIQSHGSGETAKAIQYAHQTPRTLNNLAIYYFIIFDTCNMKLITNYSSNAFVSTENIIEGFLYVHLE